MADWDLQDLTGRFDDTTPAKTVTATADIDLATLEGTGAMCQLKVTWGAAADGDATVKWYTSADGGTTVGLDRTDTFTVQVSGSYIRSFRALNVPLVRVTALNGNSAVEDITLVLNVALLRHGTYES